MEAGEETSLLLSINREIGNINLCQGKILGEIKTLGSKIEEISRRQDRLENTHDNCHWNLCERVEVIEKRLEGEDAVERSNDRYRNRFYSLLSFVIGALSVYITWKSISG